MRLRAIPTLLRLVVTGHTDGVINSVSAAWDLAVALGHLSISPEHLIAGMIKADEGRPPSILRRMRLSINSEELTELIDPAQPGRSACRCHFHQATLDLLAGARQQSRALGHHYIGTEHILLALLLGPSRPASNWLRGRKIEAEAIRLAATHSA
jgi:ATP-dependent Clp protease ATP-binding subunit ClpC